MNHPVFRNALITGASSGIGAALARQLAARGTHVGLAARRLEALEELADEIRSAGGRARVYVLDVTDRAAVASVVQRADRELDGLDLVLANAGVGEARHMRNQSLADLELVLNVNLLGAVATLHAGMEAMLPRARGTLAATSSVAGMRGLPTAGSYSASKAGLSNFLETMAVDLASSGLRVVDLRPGFVTTPMTADNRFSMPFLIDAEDAASRMVRALEGGRGVLTFPLPMALLMTLVAHLPWWLYRRAAPILKPRNKTDRQAVD